MATLWLDIDDTMVDFDLVEKEDSYDNVPPLPGLINYLTKAKRVGYNIYIISWYNNETSKHRVESKYQWCLRHLGKLVDYDNVAVIPAPTNKAEHAKKMLGESTLTNKDYLIDDNEDNVKAWKEAGGIAFQFNKKIMSWENF